MLFYFLNKSAIEENVALITLTHHRRRAQILEYRKSQHRVKKTTQMDELESFRYCRICVLFPEYKEPRQHKINPILFSKSPPQNQLESMRN